MSVLEVKNVNKKFKNHTALYSVNFSLGEGEVVGFVGPNGAGKSTLIKSILGLYKIDSGSINICGHDIKTDFENALKNVGCVIEKPDFYSNISGRKNLEICALMNGITDFKVLDSIIEFVRLENKIDDLVHTYSLGMKQRLGIAQALINKPKLLILDEPTNGLDPIGMKDLRTMLKRMSIENKMTIFISSHLLSEVEYICDRVILINKGSIIGDMPMGKVKENHSLEEVFLEKVTGHVVGDLI